MRLCHERAGIMQDKNFLCCTPKDSFTREKADKKLQINITPNLDEFLFVNDLERINFYPIKIG